MKRSAVAVVVLWALGSVAVVAQSALPTDRFETSAGVLEIGFVGHGTLFLQIPGTVIHVDPVGRYGSYDRMPKADIILLTHEHGDHVDPAAIAAVRKEGTVIIANEGAAKKLADSPAQVMRNGEIRTVGAGFSRNTGRSRAAAWTA